MSRPLRTERLLRLVATLKRQGRMSAVQFIAALNRQGVHGICVKTVHRDVEQLRATYGAPIDYDESQHGYFLSNPDWHIPYVTLQRDELFASLLCGQLSHPLLPEPLRTHADAAMISQLAAGDPGDYAPALLEAVILATGESISLSPGYFTTILEAWGQCHRLHVTYRRSDGQVSQRDLDIHALFLSDGAWYARAYCHLRHEVRSLALHRFLDVQPLEATFHRDPGILAELRAGRVFNYPLDNDVTVRVTPEVAVVIREREWFPKQTIKQQKDGSLLLSWPSVPHPLLIRWVLAYAGDIEVVAPANLRAELRTAGRAIADRHCLLKRGAEQEN